MCVDYSIRCQCGKSHASFNFKDNVLPHEVIANLYCPSCSSTVNHDRKTMLSDNGWTIEFNMEVARFMLSKVVSAHQVVPELIFDEGFCTWRGMTPTDHIDSVHEREQLLRLAKTDPRRYFEAIKSWANNRQARLAQKGWRKAQEQEPVKL